jgi:hypothetical protein
MKLMADTAEVSPYKPKVANLKVGGPEVFYGSFPATLLACRSIAQSPIANDAIYFFCPCRP